jgi:hypothetical protein
MRRRSEQQHDERGAGKHQDQPDAKDATPGHIYPVKRGLRRRIVVQPETTNFVEAISSAIWC